jgi:hypothetical protein
VKVAKSTFECELGASVIVANKFRALEGRRRDRGFHPLRGVAELGRAGGRS